MIERKSNGANFRKNSKTSHIKPSKYIDMVVSALYSLKDSNGSIPKNIVDYISNTYDIVNDEKTISSNVYRALKKGLNDGFILKLSYGHYTLSTKTKHGKVPAKKRRKKKKGKKKGKKRRKKKKKKAKKKGKRRRRSKRRKKSKKRRRRAEKDYDEPPRRRGRQRKVDPNEPPRRRGRPRKIDPNET